MMRVFKDIATLPAFKNAVITIGTFDGVHIGHQKIINQLKKAAQLVDGETVIITFDPHPRQVISQGINRVPVLTTLEEKIALLEKFDIDNLVVVEFNNSFSEMSAEAYIQEFLYQNFQPRKIVIGYDHRFGKGRIGDYHLLESEGEKIGFEVEEISEKLLHESIVSSTKIRNAVKEGEIQTANECLGHPYFFEGEVVDGNKLGRTIGYPTANILVENENKLIPANGVYAVWVKIAGRDQMWKGMMNIGIRPTVGNSKRTIEVNILDFDEQIYGETLQVDVISFLRNEVKFNGLDALKKQLAEDKRHVEAILK